MSQSQSLHFWMSIAQKTHRHPLAFPGAQQQHLIHVIPRQSVRHGSPDLLKMTLLASVTQSLQTRSVQPGPRHRSVGKDGLVSNGLALLEQGLPQGRHLLLDGLLALLSFRGNASIQGDTHVRFLSSSSCASACGEETPAPPRSHNRV
jgi:hypothetical protein